MVLRLGCKIFQSDTCKCGKIIKSDMECMVIVVNSQNVHLQDTVNSMIYFLRTHVSATGEYIGIENLKHNKFKFSPLDGHLNCIIMMNFDIQS